MTELEIIEQQEFEKFHAESKRVGEQILRLVADVKAPVVINAIVLVTSFLVDRFPEEAKVASVSHMINSLESLIQEHYPEEGQTLQ